MTEIPEWLLELQRTVTTYEGRVLFGEVVLKEERNPLTHPKAME